MTHEKSSERRDIYKERRKMSEADAMVIAKRFHEAYERLAPEYGYETRHDTREFDPKSPNGKLMTAVCLEVGRFIESIAFEEGFRAGREESTPELRRHVAAMEADSGAGAPFGYRVTGGEPAQKLVQSWLSPFATLVPNEVGMTDEWGADLLPLQAEHVPVVGVAQDVSEYFEWHHTAGDTVDKIRPRELAQAQAAFFALVHAAANSETRLPPSPRPSRF